MVDFSQRLNAALAQAGMTRAQLAKRLGVSEQSLRKFELGTSKIMSAENLAHTARILGVDYYWMATGMGEMHAHMPAQMATSEAAAPEYLPSPAWPFRHVTHVEWQRLSAEQRAFIEGQVRALAYTAAASASDAATQPPV